MWSWFAGWIKSPANFLAFGVFLFSFLFALVWVFLWVFFGFGVFVCVFVFVLFFSSPSLWNILTW